MLSQCCDCPHCAVTYSKFTNIYHSVIIIKSMDHICFIIFVGSVLYQTFSSNNPLANDVFNDVNSFVKTSKNITSYKGIWMLVMEWRDVHPYPHGSYYYYYYYYYYDQVFERVRQIILFHLYVFYF